MSEQMSVSREQVLRFRVAAHQFDRSGGHGDARILDLGAQDTGPDGARWALAIRGAKVPDDELLWAWSLRGAPHAYRRAEAAEVAAAVAPWSEADAAKRIFDAAPPARSGRRASRCSTLSPTSPARCATSPQGRSARARCPRR